MKLYSSKLESKNISLSAKRKPAPTVVNYILENNNCRMQIEATEHENEICNSDNFHKAVAFNYTKI